MNVSVSVAVPVFISFYVSSISRTLVLFNNNNNNKKRRKDACDFFDGCLFNFIA